jgi:hypothetical protein
MKKLQVDQKRDLYMIFGQYIKDNQQHRNDFCLILYESGMLLDKITSSKNNKATKGDQADSFFRNKINKDNALSNNVRFTKDNEQSTFIESPIFPKHKQ